MDYLELDLTTTSSPNCCITTYYWPFMRTTAFWWSQCTEINVTVSTENFFTICSENGYSPIIAPGWWWEQRIKIIGTSLKETLSDQSPNMDLRSTRFNSSFLSLAVRRLLLWNDPLRRMFYFACFLFICTRYIAQKALYLFSNTFLQTFFLKTV